MEMINLIMLETLCVPLLVFHLLSVNIECFDDQDLRMKREPKTIVLQGEPTVSNCKMDLKTAEKGPFTIKNGFTVGAIWENSGIENPLDYYHLMVNLFKWRLNTDPQKAPGEKIELQDLVTNHTATIAFDSYVATPGIYKLQYQGFLKKNPNTVITAPNFKNECYFVVKPLKPVVVLSGGVYRIVPPGIDIVLNANETINLDRPNDENNINSLDFFWRCSQSWCKDSSTSTTKITIPANYVRHGETFTISLTVRTIYDGEDSTKQTIKVEENAASLRIECRKNCPPSSMFSNPQQLTYLRAVCDTNCGGIVDADFEWEVELKDDAQFKFDFEKHSRYGQYGNKLFIYRNALDEGKVYLISLKLKKAKKKPGVVTWSFAFTKKPSVKNCVIIPSEGVALITLFKLQCEQEGEDPDNYYELYIDKDLSETVLHEFYPNAFSTDFFLPSENKADREFTVRVADAGGPALKIKVSATVKTASAEEFNQNAIFRYIMEPNVENMFLSHDYEKRDKAVKSFQALVNEILPLASMKEMHTMVKSFFMYVVYSVMRSPIRSSGHLRTVCYSMANLLKHYHLSYYDPVVANLSTSLCQLMAMTYLDDIRNARIVSNRDAISNIIIKCTENNIHENRDLITPGRLNLSVPDMDPELATEELTLELPDYYNIDNRYLMNIKQLSQVAVNIFNSTAVMLKSIVLEMAPGERFDAKGNTSTYAIVKDIGFELVNKKILIANASITPSKDFTNVFHRFDFLLAIWERDPLWWNSAHIVPVTPIMLVQIWHSNCRKRIRFFLSPSEVTFPISKRDRFREIFVKKAVKRPKNFEKLSNKELNSLMNIHRIDFPRRGMLTISFSDISEENSVDVAITTFQFPTINHFKDSFTITAENHTPIFINNKRNYDQWAYLAILPRRNGISNKTSIPYKVSFVLSFCIRWKEKESIWETACKQTATTNTTIIGCTCNHFSAMAGYVQNTKTLQQKVHPVEIELELLDYYIVFITVTVTLYVYFLLIMLLALRTKQSLYFLADNHQDHLYAYLLNVRTENKTNSSTTSKVMIKITGKKSATDPHVLNYPDPKMRLLQRDGEDTFVLTTEAYLGDVSFIELWYDCSGASPSWRCRDLVIYDMQNRLQWYFKVKTYFSVTRGVTYLKMAPCDDRRMQFFSRIRICNHFHTWQLWARDTNFPFHARITTVLSNVLTTYTLVFILQGMPLMALRDCFDKYHVPLVDENGLLTVFWAAIVSFALHVGIAWFFRFTKFEFEAKGKRFHLTHHFSILGWCLLFPSIICNVSFLTCFGFWLPWNSSIVWLILSVMAIVFQIIVLENILIMIETWVCRFKLVLEIDKKIPKYITRINQQRKHLFRKISPVLLRPFLAHLYKPLKGVQIIRRRIVVQLRRRILDDLEDLSIYALFNVFLYLTVLLNKPQLTIFETDEVVSMIEGEHTRTLPFSEITSMIQFFEYLNVTLIPTMQPNFWYMNSTLKNARMIDNSHKFIGTVRLRQHRVLPNCKIPKIMNFLNVTCTPELHEGYDDKQTYGLNWANDTLSEGNQRYLSFWEYKTPTNTGSGPTIGAMRSYSGGGYVAFLGRTIYNSFLNLYHLMKNDWIDPRSRNVVTEFLLYNCNQNLFAEVKLFLEYSATGYLEKTIHVNVVRMLLVHTDNEVMSTVVLIVFCIAVAMLNIKLAIGICKNPKTFYKNSYIIIDLLVNVLSITTVTIFMVRIGTVKEYLDSLEAIQDNSYISYYNIMTSEEVINYLWGFLICLATVRLWRFLRFATFFRIFERTLAIGAFALIAATFSFGVIVCAFTLSGLLIYGEEFPELSTFLKMAAALFQMALKPDQFDIKMFMGPGLSYYYFSAYLIMMQIIMLIYITIIIMAYVKAQLELSVEPESYNVIEYIKEHIDYFPKLIKTRLHRMRAGEQASPVTPKADEFRYANCVSTRKSSMRSMKILCYSIIRNMTQTLTQQMILTEYEMDLMLEICRTFIWKQYEDDVEVFFKGHFAGHPMCLVDEKRIDKIAEFVKLMFDPAEEEEAESSTQAQHEQEKEFKQLVNQKNETLRRCRGELQTKAAAFSDIMQRIDSILAEDDK